MSRDLDERLRDHFATRDQELTVTPFDEVFVEEDFAKEAPTRMRGLAAIAASVLVVGVATWVWINQEETQPDPLFAEITSTVMWQAPSDRISQQRFKLNALSTPNLDWPDNKVTRLGALEEIKL